MAQNDVMQIKVNNLPVGVIGLKAVIEEMAITDANSPDEKVREELFKRLGKKNYIPEKAKDDYRDAFLREFKKFLGQLCEEEQGGLEIKVLGPGCYQCDKLEQELMHVMTNTGIMADVEHVRDLKEIGEYGVMGTPALIINGKIKSMGRVPTRNQLTAWLKEAKR